MDRIQSMMEHKPPPAHAVILVMGETGVGKSTFISKLSGEDAGIGHDLISYTKGIGIYSMTIADRVVYLVDTPGFNDTWRSDLEILQEIAYITSRIYRRGMVLAGILCLHRISDNRVSGSARKIFTLLERMCGPEAAPNVFLITTMWDLTETGKLSHQEAEMRETCLGSTLNFWGKLSQQGSQTKRWQGDYGAALSIVNELLELNDKFGMVTQRLQRELVDEGKTLVETAVGQELLTEYMLTERTCTDKLSFIEHGMGNELESATSLAELRSKLQDMKDAQKQLRVSLRSVFAEREMAYGQVLDQVRAEQEQLSQELEIGERDCERLRADTTANEALLHEERQSWQLRRRQIDNEERIGRRTQASADTERHRLAEEEADFLESLEELNLENEKQCIDTNEAVDKMRKRDVMKRNLFPFLGILGGTALGVAGAVTGIAPLAGAGIGVGFAYAIKLEFSRKIKDRNVSKVTVWEGAVGGGQGALGASID